MGVEEGAPGNEAKFSGRTDAPEARCDLTDTQTHYSNPRSCAPRVNNDSPSAVV